MTTRFLTFGLGDAPAYTTRAHLAMLATMGQAPAGSEFLIITDRPENYRWFEGHAQVSAVDQATIARWKGPQDFFWRIEIEVLRYNPETDSEPHAQVFEVPFTDDMSVLQGVQYIKDYLDGSLSFRWSCRMAICGSCGMMINGVPKLSCETFIRDY